MSTPLEPARRRFKLIVEFDGADFSGWQRQKPGTRTVQGEIEAALQQILQQKVTLIGSGRTDAGVHGLAQTAHADLALGRLRPEKLLDSLNSLLAKDVQVLSLAEVDPRFHARFDALSRTYHYRIERRPHPLTRRQAWTPSFEWDDSIIVEGVKLLSGRHSFLSFCLQRPGEEGYLCTVSEAIWEVDEAGSNFRITADRFFHKMVRGLVGAMIDLGRGRYSLEDFRRLIDEPVRNGVVTMAPPQGLFLVKVSYE